MPGGRWTGHCRTPVSSWQLLTGLATDEEGGQFGRLYVFGRRLLDHDLDAAVLRLAYAVAGRNQRLGLAPADH